MAGHECYHCKQWVDAGEPHDCWTTTERALTAGLADDLLDAWERLRETAASFGEQRIYASHHCIMFSRQACYFFVRPKRNVLEICIFLGRTIQAAQIRRVDRASQRKLAHIVHVRHRDEVESPITDWLREAFDVSDDLSARGTEKQADSSRAERRRLKEEAAAKRVVATPTPRTKATRRQAPKRSGVTARAPKRIASRSGTARSGSPGRKRQ